MVFLHYKVRNIVVRNMEVYGVTRNAGIIEGLPESPFEGITFANITIQGADKGCVAHG
jgi:hypothetical protein